MQSVRCRKFIGLLLAAWACVPSNRLEAAQDRGDTPPAAGIPAYPPNFDPGQEAPGGAWTPVPEPDPYPDGPEASRFLLGDDFPFRSLREGTGFSFYTSFTQFEQGVASGGLRDGARWGGKFDMLAHLDTEGAGLWRGGMLDLFAESRLGQSIEGFSGSLSPANLAMYFPVPDAQVTAITGLKFTQEITDRAGLFFGKLNALNGDRERFLKYPLTSRFWNAAFNFNLALDRYPYSAPGAGFYYVPERGPSLAFLALDSYDSPRTTGLEKLFRNGAFLYAEAKQKTEFFGLPGKHTLATLWGTGAFADLAPASFIDLPQGAVPAPKRRGTWTVLWNMEQRLFVDPAIPDRGVGLYVQTGLGDGNPNPTRWFLSVALCGNVPIAGREGDTAGLGYYNLGLSQQAKDILPGLRDEPGGELFYNLRLAPGCHLTPDLQFVRPGFTPIRDALILGLRLKADF
ncbi:Carbohydrate-selective porin, OprB family [Aquisphaera giovannonii]|uniref:Carbohydrate-selective porin, OprB family n=1 Tax=Aquisphaera giovannonii TaxID=406548 RepID=A0A5B9VUE8_9BACT|nr:carbohydrate porin [Aquisphaera giovannonii]QEH31719.1 Carbohydrate-selective porin, OprB family [Aquisphaera giovannonii]